MTQQIGILFWGCKGGHRNFCDNGLIDVYSPEIRQTYKDVRSFATFAVSNTGFYALEFTANYKVYTHYSSSNDSGTGAFIAVTLYVPHSLQVIGIRQIMDKLLDEYFDQYFNPLTNSPIPGKRDDITPFQQMFDELSQGKIIADNNRYFKAPSVQDDNPQILAYSSLDELDAYFASPYRPEFFRCQEVMLISKDILENQSQYGLRFQITPIFIQHVSDPEPEPYIGLFPASKDFRLSLFKVNDVDYTARQGDVPLYPTALVSMRIEGNKYQKPIAFENVPVEKILEAGLIRKNGSLYEFLPVYNLDFEEFRLKAHIEGDDSGTCYQCFGLRSLDNPSVVIPGSQFDPRSSMYSFGVSGKHLSNRYQLQYSVMPGFTDLSLIIDMKQVQVESLITQNLTLETTVTKHVFNFVYPEVAPGVMYFKITSSDKSKTISGRFLNPAKTAELYLPSEFAFTNRDVELHADGFAIKQDPQGRYVVYPETVDVEIVMPSYLANLDMSALIPAYYIGDDLYKGRWAQGKCIMRLPYEWLELPGKLILSGKSFNFDKVDRSNISFKCAVVSNRTTKPLSFEVIYEDFSMDTRKLRPNNLDLLPVDVEIRVPAQFQDIIAVDEKGFTSDNRTKLFLLVPRQLQGPASGNPSNLSGQGNGEDQRDNENQRRPQNQRNHGNQGAQSSQNNQANRGFSIDEPEEHANKGHRQSKHDEHGRDTKRVLTKTTGTPSNIAFDEDPTHNIDLDHGNRHPGQFTHPSQERTSGNENPQKNEQTDFRENGNTTNNASVPSQGTGSEVSGAETGAATAGNPNIINYSQNHVASSEASHSGNNGNKLETDPRYFIRLINCNTLKARLLQADNTYRIVPIANLNTSDYIPVNPKRSQVKLLDSREKQVCVVNFPASEYRRDTYMAQQNVDNGFNVTWMDDNHCIVNYRKNSLFGKLRDVFINNKKLLVGVISILIIALITACWLLIEGRSQDYKLDLRFDVDQYIVVQTDDTTADATAGDSSDVTTDEGAMDTPTEAFDPRNNPQTRLSAVGYKGQEYKGDSIVMTNSGKILNVIALANPKVIPSVGGEPSDLFVVYDNGELVPILKENKYAENSFVPVICPEDIRIVTMNAIPMARTKGNPSTKSAETTTDKLNAILNLLSNPKEIDKDINIQITVPSLTYLKAFQQLRQTPEVDDRLIDSLAAVYPNYQKQLIQLKEAKAADINHVAAEEEVTATVEVAEETPSKKDDDKVAQKDTKDTKTSNPTTTTPSAPKAPTTPAAPATTVDPKNQAIINQYHEKLAQLQGIFNKQMVDELISFEKANASVLKEEMAKNRPTVWAYDNFVHGKPYEITRLTSKQQAVINAVKAINPPLVESRDYPAIFKEYQSFGGK